MWQALTNISNNIGIIFTKIAHQAGIAFTHIWIVLSKQQLILGLQDLLRGLVLVVIAIVMGFGLRKVIKKQWFLEDKLVASIILGVLGIYFLIVGLNLMIDSLPRILNPEYYAMQDAVRMLQNLKQ